MDEDIGHSKIVVGLGEVLWDCFADSRRPGGAPANVAFHAGQMGNEGIVCSRVGTDPLGDELVDYLHRQGLSADHIQRDEARPTGTVTVDASRPDHPSYAIHEDVAWDAIEAHDSLLELMARTAAVCFGTLAQRSVTSRNTIRKCLQAAGNALVVYDVNLRQNYFNREIIEQSLELAHVVKLNGDEALVLGELLEIDVSDLEAFAGILRERFQVDLTCVTRGGEGCILFSAESTAEVPGEEVTVVDAVGAGDAFTAALITTRLRGIALETSAAFANRVGGLVASRAGAMPDLRSELQGLLPDL